MFVIQIIDADGEIRYVQVRAGSAGEARNIAASRAGLSPSERIGTVASRLFFESQNVTLPQNIQEITGAAQPPESQPPTSQPPAFVDPGSAGGGLSGVSTPIRGSEQFEFGPAFEAGLRDRGINIGPGGGTIGALARQQFDPLRSRAFISTAFNAPGGEFDPDATPEEIAGPTFQEFVRTGNIFGPSAAQSARALLEQARGFGSQFENAGLLGAGLINPATSGQGVDLANIAREAARQRFGSFARFLPSSQALSQSFFSQPAGTQETFADFLNRRIFG